MENDKKSGKDPKDQTSIASTEISEEAIATSIVKTVGYFKNFIENDAIDAQVKADFLATIEKVKAKGIKVKELDFFKIYNERQEYKSDSPIA